MRLVEGPWDFASDAAIVRLRDLPQGRLAIVAPPDAGTIGPVAAAILKGLGKSSSVAPQAHVARDEVLWATIWLQAFEIRTVIVHRVDRLPDILVELDDLLVGSGCAFYGIADPPWVPFLEARLGRRVESTLRFDDLVGLWPAPPAHMPVEKADRAVLDATAMRDRLARIRMPVDGARPAYLAGFVGAASLPRPERPKATLLASRLRPLLEPMTDPHCFGQAVRGAAVAQLPFGWEITLDAARLARGVRQSVISERDGLTFRSFWIFRDPQQGAAWVLSRLPISLLEILEVTVGDVEADGSMVAVGGEWFDMPLDARPLLRAQLIARRRADTTDSGDPLIVRPGGRPTTQEWLVGLLRATGAEANVRTADRQLYLRPSGDQRWLEDRGVSLRWIREAQRGDAWADPARLAMDGELVRECLASPVRSECQCDSAHVPGPIEVLAGWPPTKFHAPPRPDHPWRSDFVWSGRQPTRERTA